MVQSLSNRYHKHIALVLFSIFYLELLMPAYAAISHPYDVKNNSQDLFLTTKFSKRLVNKPSREDAFRMAKGGYSAPPTAIALDNKLDIGGPSSPEASSFKAVGSDNLVNLFTGDLSYSVPLMDVGGYPVNLFYSGGISMEQEASWVGLGWNINPGSVSRNMRGVPDDFNGEDLLKQSQNTKPNRTWGGVIGADAELLGIKNPAGLQLGFSLGASYNNYLGPELIAGASLSASIPLFEGNKAEKSAVNSLGLSGSLGAKLSSRSGLTFSPSLGLKTQLLNNNLQLGVGLSTSYNSRSGISALQLHSELSHYAEQNNGKSKDEPGYKSLGYSTSKELGSSTISFAKPSYMPALRMPLQNSYTSAQIELGGGIFGFRGSGTINGYYSESKVPDAQQVIYKPLVGYIYSENAVNNVNAVMDLNRLNDAEVTPNTPVISAPQYTYDIFSIQGEGTGGTIRAYRGDLGIMRDNVTNSTDGSLSLGVDIAPPGHFGFNVNTVSTPTKVGGWEDANNTLRQTIKFKPKTTGVSFENVYFRNPGEATVTNDDIVNRVGKDSLVRFQLSGSNALPRIETALELFSKKTGIANGIRPLINNISLPKREKRTQVTTMLTAADASVVGLEKYIRNYKVGSNMFDPTDNHLVYDSFPRITDIRKKHHLSEIDVLEQNGMRYVYGLPVYSITQKDFTFSVGRTADNNNMVTYDSTNDPTLHSTYMNNSSNIDGYTQIQETPAYASSFLLTGLISPDYVDVTGNGITEDDLGNAVKFNYTQSTDTHKWRTPRSNDPNLATVAHFNDGKRSEKRDNKATISYGEREAWYLNSIESKSMIAIFTTDSRDDSKGVLSAMNGQVNTAENANKRLTKIDLYTKSDIKTNGFNKAIPIKTVQFFYSYALCKGTPDNINGNGKLTLDSISFSYNGQTKQKKSKYVFNYGNKASQADNPNYLVNASDRWGTYKPASDPMLNQSVNPNGQNNIDFPYTSTDKTKNDGYAAAWGLKKILLPSGGQMEFKYEVDDYAFVQDRRACNMYTIYGLGNTTRAATTNKLYNYNSAVENLYVYVQLPQPLVGTTDASRRSEIYSKYLDGLNQLAFKLQVLMPKGMEPLTVYATNIADYGLCINSNNNDIIYIKLGDVDGKSPLAKSATSFLIENLPGQAFEGYDNFQVSGLLGFLGLIPQMLSNIPTAFTNAESQVRLTGKGMKIVLANSFVRLTAPNKIKYGGGYRVKQVLVRDNWNRMTGKYTSTYGQDYDYTTTENINGIDTTISSGVASYEPGIGSEENPFREILQFSNKMPLASAQYGAIEMPILEGMYPSPVVGYSKVTVRSIHRKGTHGDSTLRSAIGKQVTEYFTARDFPSYSTYTNMQSMDYHKNPFFSFFTKEMIDRRIISQGFLIETNDMHGRMKYQAAYSESDEKTPLSASYHTYKNTGKNGLNDKVDYVYNEEGGAVRQGNMGVDIDLMTDVREFSIESNGTSIQPQFDSFIFGGIFTLWPTYAYTENKYRAVTTTKTVSYHAIEDSVVVIDKGSVITTKTIAYDAGTGIPIVSQTANEFNAPIYNITYPAYWAYSGMGLAYKNVDAIYTANFYDGSVSGIDNSVFESGDELYIITPGSGTLGCVAPSGNATKLWALDINKNTTALTVPVKNLIFIDETGKPFTQNSVTFRIIRSGRRNMLDAKIGGATLMTNPIVVTGNLRALSLTATSKIVTASAVEYKEKWQTDRGVIQKMSSVSDGNCGFVEVVDCNGNHLEKSINPYSKGLIGNYKPYRSLVFYDSRTETAPSVATNIAQNGYLANFKHYWNFNTANNLVPDTLSTQWVWNSQITKVNAKGLELETKNALGIYTAAQYGFNKTLPVAVTNNSRANESFFEGFEDANYNESISNTSINNCLDSKHIDLSGLGSIVSTEGLGFNAHSGKKVIGINAGTSGSINLPLSTAIDDFNFFIIADTTKALYQLGGTITKADINPFVPSDNYVNDASPQALWERKTAFSNGGFTIQGGIIIRDNITNNGNTRFHYFEVNNSYYINVANSGYYNFGLKYDRNESCNLTALSMQISLTRIDGGSGYFFGLTNSPYYNYNNVFICQGIYKVSTIIRNAIGLSLNDNGSNINIPWWSYWPSYNSQWCVNNMTSRYWGWYCPYGFPDGGNNSWGYPNISFTTNAATDNYKTLTTQNGCISNKPIPASDSMFNRTFSVPLNKQMLFSAWVHEGGSNKISYDSNQVIINGTPLKPKGAVIDGWQRYEAPFTVTSGSSLSLQVVNNSQLPIYLDDIRVHPFNGNMKSYVYDPRTLRLSAELDENNYASYYEYDEEGQLVRVKKETIQGVKTIKETRSAKQKSIIDIVQ